MVGSAQSSGSIVMSSNGCSSNVIFFVGDNGYVHDLPGAASGASRLRRPVGALLRQTVVVPPQLHAEAGAERRLLFQVPHLQQQRPVL